MKREQIMETIYNLGRFQGSYSRLYWELDNIRKYDEDRFCEIMDELENQNFTDTVDLIMYIEC